MRGQPARHGLDELGAFLADRVRDGEPHDGAVRFEIVDAARPALLRQLGLPFVAPFEDEAPGRIDLDDLAGIRGAARR